MIFILLISSGTLWAKSTWRGYFQADYTSSDNPHKNHGFQLRRINLMFNRELSEKIRAFADIEYEDGTAVSAGAGQGEIKISRGFAEFRLSRDLKVAAGKFLTPYGYYNEIHDFSASYTPIDPPILVYGKTDFFGNNSYQRLFPKYSTGLRFNYKKDNLNMKFGVANGANQNSSGGDANRTPMSFLKMEYSFLDNSTISASYLKDKVNTASNPKWEDHGIISLDIELLNFFMISEVSMGNKRNQSLSNVSTNYLGHSQLLGTYFGDSYSAYLNYQRLAPDRSDKGRYMENYIIGLNYYISIFTVLKAEVEKHEVANGSQLNNYYTQQVSLSMLF